MKVVFLDFDGVLNSDRYFSSALYDRQLPPVPGLRPEYIHYLRKLDTDAVGMFANFVTLHGLKVVISSNWREAFGVTLCAELLNALGNFPKGAITSATPLDGRLTSRGEEIEAWLKERRQGIHGYVILDDLPVNNFLPGQRGNLVKTDARIGLTVEDLVRTEQILHI